MLENNNIMALEITNMVNEAKNNLAKEINKFKVTEAQITEAALGWKNENIPLFAFGPSGGKIKWVLRNTVNSLETVFRKSSKHPEKPAQQSFFRMESISA